MNEKRPGAQTFEILSLVLALLLVLLIAGLSYRAWSAFGRGSEELTKSTEIVDQANELISRMKDAESAQRGYLLTGEERYLDPYNQAAVAVPATLEALKTLVAGIPDQAQRVDQLAPVIAEKLGELAQTIELRRNSKADEALAVVRTDRGKLTMDQIRTRCADIETHADLRLDEYAAKSTSSADQLGVIATVGGAILFVLLGLATVTIHRTNLRRERLIEDLRSSEEQTKVARDWFETTLASIGDGVIATDAMGKVTLLNPVAQELTGWSSSEAIGQPLESIFVIHNEETWAVAENPVRRALREGRIIGLANHTALTAKSGKSISIDDTAAPIPNPQGEIAGVVLVFRNVTMARERERQQERSRHALASANKDLQQFAYAASHDLREPLRTIKIFTQLLEGAASALDEQHRQHLSFILDGTDRMEQLVNALLEYSTAGAPSEKPLAEINVEEVLAGTLNNLRAAIEESGAIVTHEPLPSLVAEPSHLGLVFQNLIGNAIKYRRDDPPRIHISAKHSADEWIFSVADNGLGIRPEYHTSIFDIFKRLHTQNLSGSGIGLATCRRIVERYHGRIGVHSQLGRGSTFFFSLPAQSGVARAQTHAD